MKQYLVTENDTTTKSLQCAVPFSLRDTPKHIRDFDYENDFAIMPVNMRLISNAKTELQVIKKDLAYLKTSPMPFGHFYLTNFVMMLPYFIQRILVEDLGSKLTMGFSNVPGSRLPWVITGKQCHAHAFNIPLGATVSCGWGAASHANNLKLMFGSDKNCITDVESVMEMLENNLDSVLETTEWRKFYYTGEKN